MFYRLIYALGNQQPFGSLNEFALRARAVDLIPTEYHTTRVVKSVLKEKLINAKIRSFQTAFYHCKYLCWIRTLSTLLFLHLHDSKNQSYLFQVSLFV